MWANAEMNSSPWYEGKWQVSEAAWVVHWGGTWQTENLQLQWHSLAAQVIADISNVWSAKPAKCQQTCKSTDYLQEKPKCLSSVVLPTPNNQNILIVQLNERVDVVHFFNKIKSWHNYNNAFFVAIVHNRVIQVHRVQKSTKIWHAKCLKTRLYLVNKNWNFISVLFKSVFPVFFVFLNLFL